MKRNAVDWYLRERLYDESVMYRELFDYAEKNGKPEMLAALPFMREKHSGHFRRGKGFVPYSNHPLMMAYHSLSMGVDDDILLAALLLHDCIEDCGVYAEEIPCAPQVRELVQKVTKTFHVVEDPVRKAFLTEMYYQTIGSDPKAAYIKCVDRCNNLSTMAMGFSREKMEDYVRETEDYVIPLLDKVKGIAETDQQAVWILRYHLYSLLETLKRVL